MSRNHLPSRDTPIAIAAAVIGLIIAEVALFGFADWLGGRGRGGYVTALYVVGSVGGVIILALLVNIPKK